MAFALDNILPQVSLDQLLEQALYAIQAADAATKEGIAEAAAARGQAFMDPATLLGDALDASSRAALARAPLDVLFQFLQLAIQIQLQREQQEFQERLQNEQIAAQVALENLQSEHAITLETLRGTNELAAIDRRAAKEIEVLTYRDTLNQARYQKYLDFVTGLSTGLQGNIVNILNLVNDLLGFGGDTDPDVIRAKADAIAAAAAAIRQPIYPPAPPAI